MMKLYVSLLSRNYDIFSGFDIRLAAQPVAATFSFGRTVVCFHATICAHTLDTALRSICLSFSLFDPIFLTCLAFSSDANQILEEIMYYIVLLILYADVFIHRAQI